jgi:hypothetical protein
VSYALHVAGTGGQFVAPHSTSYEETNTTGGSTCEFWFKTTQAGAQRPMIHGDWAKGWFFIFYGDVGADTTQITASNFVNNTSYNGVYYYDEDNDWWKQSGVERYIYDSVFDGESISGMSDDPNKTGNVLQYWSWQAAGMDWYPVLGAAPAGSTEYPPVTGQTLDVAWGTKLTMQPPPSVVYLDGNWHHLAGTVTNGYLRVFFDGVLVSLSTGGVAPTGSGILGIGNGGEYTGQPFVGDIDEVRFSNKVRYPNGNTIGETNFTPATSFTPDANTVGYWKFNEGAGTLTVDSSGNSRNATNWGTGLSWTTGR